MSTASGDCMCVVCAAHDSATGLSIFHEGVSAAYWSRLFSQNHDSYVWPLIRHSRVLTLITAIGNIAYTYSNRQYCPSQHSLTCHGRLPSCSVGRCEAQDQCWCPAGWQSRKQQAAESWAEPSIFVLVAVVVVILGCGYVVCESCQKLASAHHRPAVCR